MKSVRALLPVALIAVAPVLAACGGNDDAQAKDDVSTSSSMPVDRSTDASTPASSDATSASAPESSMTDSGVPAACDVVKKIDIATAYGVTPAAGVDNGASCTFVAKNFLTATVSLAPDCPGSAGEAATSVEVKGATDASWAETSSQPYAAVLVACGDGANLLMTLAFQPGYQHEGDPQAQTIGLAETVLQRLA